MSLLLATFLSVSTVALAARAGKNDVYQAHVTAFCALISIVGGAVARAGVIDLMFGYLLWGCVIGLGGSWILHRAFGMVEKKQEKLVEYTEEKTGL